MDETVDRIWRWIHLGVGSEGSRDTTKQNEDGALELGMMRWEKNFPIPQDLPRAVGSESSSLVRGIDSQSGYTPGRKRVLLNRWGRSAVWQ